MNEKDIEHMQDYLAWRENVTFYHADEEASLLNRDDVLLDVWGSYTILCNSVEDFITFACKLEDTTILEQNGIIKTVWQVEDEEELDDVDNENTWREHHMLCEQLWEQPVQQMYTIGYNPCMPVDKQVHTVKTTKLKRSRESIMLLGGGSKNVDFPAVFYYGAGRINSKIGDQVRNCCHFFSLNVESGSIIQLVDDE